MTFEPGTLWNKIAQTTDLAIRKGALLPIPTDFEFVEDAGVRFLVRVVTNVARKHETPDGEALREGSRRNPFLPYEQDLYVADVSPTHVCVLNKFNVVDHHLLIITREFEHQDTPLTLADFQALWMCMAEYESLGFYNGGTMAGASQPHKHLQLTPLPLARGKQRTPIDPLIDAADIDRPFGRCDSLPFRHVVTVFEPGFAAAPHAAARQSMGLYRKMMHAIGRRLPSENEEQTTGPYNLLITQRWMMVVPRCEECFASISLNSLAYAGALLVKNQNQMDQLKYAGPMTALCHTAGSVRSDD